MDADDHPVEVVLKEARRFMVPLYQRKYQWDEERLLPFWEDVEAKAAEVLDETSKFEHYMGALILSPVEMGSQIGLTPIVQVVDGQQRLTTFQLFLAALREIARDYELQDIIDHVEDYLVNVPKSKDTDPLTKFKLTPTPHDRDIFHDIIELDYKTLTEKYRSLYWGNSVPKNTAFPAFRAYVKFCDWIYEFCHHGPSDEAPENDSSEQDTDIANPQDDEPEETELELISERLEALLNALLDRLKLVVITLGENDDAQVIFETLNSMGKPLLAMDLVRNNIFHRAERQKVAVEELYKKEWDPLDHDWWRQPAPNARPKRPRIDHFLGHVLAAETGESISMRELYAEYRNFAVPKGKPRFENVEDELKLLNSYAPLYETLEGRRSEDSHLAWFGRKMSEWQVTTVYPIALQVASSKLSDDESRTVYELLYSYIARRIVCGLTTKNLNKTFQGLAAEFKQHNPSAERLRKYFSAKTGDSNRFPSDIEFKQGALDGMAYLSIKPRPRLMDILWELEKASRSKLAEKAIRPDGLWIEHVLPQSWTDEWPFEDGSNIPPSSEDTKAISRRRTIHTLGNLTLLSGSLNISAGRVSFLKKREKFTNHTSLFLNKWFNNKSKWAEAEILERGEHLAELSLKVWKPLN